MNVFTGGLRVMPMFAVTGCDYGNQTLADPASGHATTGVPMPCTRRRPHQHIDLTADTQVVTDSTGADVDSLVKDSTGNKVRFTASFWARLDEDRVLQERRRHGPADLPGATDELLDLRGYHQDEPQPHLARDRLHEALATAQRSGDCLAGLQ